MSIMDQATGPASPREVTGTYDFRRPTTFAREHVRSLAVAHEVFVRRFASGLNSTLRTVVQMEPLSVEQMSYDDYIRSMPNPTVLTTVSLAPLPAAAVLEMNVQLALALVDRMLGGQGAPVAPRRPTEIETHLLHELVSTGLDAFSETLKPLAEVRPSVGSVDYNPQLVQVVAPSEVVLLLTYRVTVAQGARSEGLLTICYPYSTLGPALNQLSTNLWLDHSLPEAQTVTAPLRDEIPSVPVRLAVQPEAIRVSARDLAGLQPGDVLRLDHAVTQPLRGSVGGADLVAGHLGRRGRRLAFQVVEWRARPDAVPPPPAATAPASTAPAAPWAPTADAAGHAPASGIPDSATEPSPAPSRSHPPTAPSTTDLPWSQTDE